MDEWLSRKDFVRIIGAYLETRAYVDGASGGAGSSFRVRLSQCFVPNAYIYDKHKGLRGIPSAIVHGRLLRYTLREHEVERWGGGGTLDLNILSSSF